MSLPSKQPFRRLSRRAKIDNQHMMSKRRQGKIIVWMHHIRDIHAAPVSSHARLHNMLAWHIKGERLQIAFLRHVVSRLSATSSGSIYSGVGMQCFLFKNVDVTRTA